MRFTLICLLLLSLAPLVPSPECTAKTQEITWQDLVPPLPPVEDPLTGLDEEELGFVEWIIYLRLYLPEEVLPENEEFHQEMDEALPQLKAKGIDVDQIIAERKQRNSAVNRELEGRVVALSGYLLPLDLSGKKISDFLLVPYIGACIHTPPPPPNQIVSAVSSVPLAFELEKLFQPVTVTGVMTIETISKELFLVDGSDDIEVGYSMEVKAITEYQPK